jgi:hypothetical protein
MLTRPDTRPQSGWFHSPKVVLPLGAVRLGRADRVGDAGALDLHVYDEKAENARLVQCSAIIFNPINWFVLPSEIGACIAATRERRR